MNLELKNVKHAEFASQETNCYEASLYADGKRIAVVSNEGHGGPDMVDAINIDALAKAEAWIVTLPEIVSEFIEDDGTPWTYAPTLETVCGDLLATHLVSKDLKRLLKSRVLFLIGGELRELKKKATAPLLEKIAQDKPEWSVLNTMPFDQALAIYKEA